MNRSACILVPKQTPYHRMDIPGCGTYEEALLRFIERNGPYNRLLLFELGPEPEVASPRALTEAVTSAYDENTIGVFRLRENRWSEVLEAANSALPGSEEEVWWFWADTPFLNNRISGEILGLFHEHKADFAFADGYPHGIAPEILYRARLESLLRLSRIKGTAVSRNGLFELIQTDINDYHIEARLSETDHRLKRLAFHGEFKRTHVLVRRLGELLAQVLSKDAWTDEDFETLFSERLHDQHSLPAYASIQISSRCPHSCSYCPYPIVNPKHLSSDPVDGKFMTLEQIQKIVARLSEIMPEGTVSISFLGEPVLNPDFPTILRYLDEQTPYDVLVETTGVGWQQETVQSILSNPPRKTTFIFGIDTLDRARYDELGKTGYDEAIMLARRFIEVLGASVYVQTVRIQGGEADLLNFYREWEKITKSIIIQKYDAFCGFLPDRKVVDLQPLERFPCWHIKRDICILVDGRVPRCKEDLSGAYSAGNIFEEPADIIWERLGDVYDAHRRGDYPDICGACDEYFTFSY